MEKTRRQFLILTSLTATSLLTGCFTGSLLKEEDEYYTEEISSILLSADGKSLVFIGKKYHYIFNAPYPLIKTLGSGFQKDIQAYFSGFNVDKSQSVVGYINLILSSAAEVDKQAAIKMGYQLQDSGGLEYRAELKGIRYKANGIQPKLASQKLYRVYEVRVTAPPEFSAKRAAKLLVSPITLAADGVLMIAAIPLLIITGVAFFGLDSIYRATESIK